MYWGRWGAPERLGRREAPEMICICFGSGLTLEL